MFFGDPITLPMLTETPTLELRSFLTKQGTQSSQAIILVPQSMNFDLNGDGCNTIEDVWYLAELWMESSAEDLNGDGTINALDFLYINIDGGVSCP